MAERKVVVELTLASGNAQARLGDLEIATKDYQKQLRELNATILKNGVATREQQLRVADLNIAIRRNQTVLRELKNDLSGATAAGLRFRDKMAEAARAGLGAFGIGTLGVAGAVTGLVSVLRGAVTTLSNFEQGNANLASILGTSRSEITALTDSAIELGPALGRLPEEVTNLQTELAKLGFTVPQILDAQEAVILLANATGEALGPSAEIAAGTLKAFGLEADQTQRLVDVMAQSFNSTSLDLSKFATSMSTIAPVARAAGVSLEQTTALIGTLSDANIDASTIGTSLRDIFIDLAAKGISMDEALRQINGSTDKLSTANELFGKRSATVALVLAENVGRANDLTTALTRAGGAAQKMADEQLNTLDGDLKKLSATYDSVILKGDVFTNVLRNLAKASTLWVQVLSGPKGVKAALTDIVTSLNGDITKKVSDLVGVASQQTLLRQRAAVQVRIQQLKELGEGNAMAELEVLKLSQVYDQLTTAINRTVQIEREAGAVQGDLTATTVESINVEDEASKTTSGRAKSVKELTAAQKEQLELEKQIAGISGGKDAIFKPLQAESATPNDNPEVAARGIVNDALNQKYEEDVKNYENYIQSKDELNILALEASGALAGSLAGMFEQQSEEFKAFATIEALISTYLGAALALSDKTIPTFVRIAAASAVILSGLGAVRKIQGFEEGGYTAKASSNKKAVGVVHANEYVVPAPILGSPRGKALVDELEAMRMRHPVRYSAPFVSGGRTTRGSPLVNMPTVGTGVTASMIASADLSRAILNMPPPVVNVHDINRVQGAVRATRVKSSL